MDRCYEYWVQRQSILLLVQYIFCYHLLLNKNTTFYKLLSKEFNFSHIIVVLTRMNLYQRNKYPSEKLKACEFVYYTIHIKGLRLSLSIKMNKAFLRRIEICRFIRKTFANFCWTKIHFETVLPTWPGVFQIRGHFYLLLSSKKV